MKIAIGCDHGGLHLKQEIKELLSTLGHEVEDFGTHSTESCDYPDYAEKACKKVQDGNAEIAILVCGTGLGMSIAANKMKDIRAVVCGEEFSAYHAKSHNNANVLCLGERVVGVGLAILIVDTFLNASFEGGRHERRVNKIAQLESSLFE